jgi:arylsulfatase
LIDIAATLYDLSGAAYPAEATPLEGRSLRPAFDGQQIEREAIYWEHEGNRAIRVGDWKLVSKHGRPWELYDIATDRVEANDLAAKHPEKVKELADKYDAWAKRARVEPWPVEPPNRKAKGK